MGNRTHPDLRRGTQRKRSTKKRKRKPGRRRRTFVGLDTETHLGKAVLICSPARAWFPSSWDSCVDVLLHHRRWVAWNVTYDAQAILAYLPARLKKRLGLFTHASYRGVRIRYVPGKFLQVWRGSKTALLIDGWPFYQMSLDRAAQKVLGEGKVDFPKAWLTQIKACLADPRRDVVVRYCQRDANLAERLFKHVADNMAKLDLEPQRPVSPATYSASYFKQELKGVSRSINRLAGRAYYGGRIETQRRGHFPTATMYDIHSAYPAQFAALQDIARCTLIEETEPREDAAYGLFRVTWTIHPGARHYLIPRALKHGTIVYPFGQWTGWYDLDTVREGRRLGYGCRILRGLQWLINEEVYPFRDKIARLYALRKDATLKQAAKLVLNSAYGKAAQRRQKHKAVRTVQLGMPIVWDGDTPFIKVYHWPQTTNLVYAAHLTARVRVQLFRALEIAGARSILCHTDSVMVEGGRLPRLPGGQGPKLGQWGLEMEEGAATVIGSGIYGTRAPGERRYVWSTRGFHLRNLTPALRARPKARRLVLNDLRALSLSQLANQRRPDWRALNALEDMPRILSLGFDRKRYWPSENPTAGQILRSSQDSEPLGYYDPPRR